MITPHNFISKIRKIFQYCFILIILLSLAGSLPAPIVQAQDQQTCTDVVLPAIADTYLRASTATTNYGSATTVSIRRKGILVDYREGGLFKFDTSSIPTSATISSASLSFNVTTGSSYPFGLYEMKRNWVEESASWNTYDGSNSWGTVGAAHTTSDRGNTNLWDNPSLSATGIQTYTLNAAGVGVVQGWVTNPDSNFGFTIQNYDGGFLGPNWIVSSKEAGNENQRPKLLVNYCKPMSVDLNYFQAVRTDAGIQLSWETVSEATLAGFDLFRRGEVGDYYLVNAEMIMPLAGGSPFGEVYTYLDEEANPNNWYEYRLESYETLDVSTSSGYILTTYWPYATVLPVIIR